MMSLLVRGGIVVSPAGRRVADVLCEDERITAVLDPGSEVRADEVIDAAGLLVFPGFIDPHIHPRDPGDTHKEDFAHASRAAAAGGVTTLLVMPNAVPPVTDVASFRRRAEEHGAVAHVDFGLWGLSLGTGNIGDLAGLFAEGAVAVKLFWGYALDKESKRLVYNTADRAPEDMIPPASIGEVLEIFQAIADAGGILAAHCEDRDILDVAQRQLGHAPEAYADLRVARPDVAESSSVAVGIELARATGCHFHVCHISSARATHLVRLAQQDGLPVTAETCPHYLLFVAADCAGRDAAMKAYPPVREVADRDALWAGVADGTIASLGSDHAPHTLADKTQAFATAPAGMVAVETMMPLLIDQMNAGRVTPERLCWAASEGTAMLYGLYPRKGAIQPGADADLVLVDPDAEWTIRGEELHSVQKHTPLEGTAVRGMPVMTILRGSVVAKDREPVGEPGGRLVRRTPGGGS
ncbi:MAG TPA: dihydroorotase family protein [Thermoleophilia bacterium]|nr:dihydroorotase family protein [Thermoleophilia bacterium]